VLLHKADDRTLLHSPYNAVVQILHHWNIFI